MLVYLLTRSFHHHFLKCNKIFLLLFPSQNIRLSAGDCWVKFIACPQTLIGMILWKVKSFQWLNLCEKEEKKIKKPHISISGYSSISRGCFIKMAKWCRVRPTMLYAMLERPLNIYDIPRPVWAWNFPILYFNKTILRKEEECSFVIQVSLVLHINLESSHLTSLYMAEKSKLWVFFIFL